MFDGLLICFMEIAHNYSIEKPSDRNKSGLPFQ